MDPEQLEALLVGEISKTFPQVQAVIFWGGAAREPYIRGRGDVDVAIVLSYEQAEEDFVRARLTELSARFRVEHDIELEPAVITHEQLAASPLSFLVPSGRYKAHGVFQYLLKHRSRVIYGHSSLVDTIPPITLDAAIRAIAPLILGKVEQIRPELEALGRADEEAGLLSLTERHLSSFLVFARTVYSVDEGEIAGKLQALEHVSSRYPRYTALMRLLAALYSNDDVHRTADAEVTRDDISSYLGLAEEVALRLGAGERS